MIEIQHLRKKFVRNIILQDINLSFSEGKVYGLMGENGAGKSTLFNCIMKLTGYQGLIKIPTGSTIGYLPDTPYFYTYVTGKEYVDFCLKARHLPINDERIEQWNKYFQLPLHHYASNYSMGMKKRLCLLALILQDSDIYIFDEPFNGLDLEGSLILKKWIKDNKNHKTTILSSHITSVLTEVCDEIHYIHNGRIVNKYVGKTTEEIEQDITDKFISVDI